MDTSDWYAVGQHVFLPILILLFAAAQRNRRDTVPNFTNSRVPQWWTRNEDIWMTARKTSSTNKIIVALVLIAVGVAVYLARVPYGFWIMAALSLAGMLLAQFITMRQIKALFHEDGTRKY